MKVLLSIKPEFVREIASGNKKFEYRKRIFKRKDISSIVVYATKPYGKVVGEFKIEKIIIDEPNRLWEQTKKHSGITKSFFNEYFKGRDTGVAIKIKEYLEYDDPMELNEFDSNLKGPPQSFYYVGEGV